MSAQRNMQRGMAQAFRIIAQALRRRAQLLYALEELAKDKRTLEGVVEMRNETIKLLQSGLPTKGENRGY